MRKKSAISLKSSVAVDLAKILLQFFFEFVTRRQFFVFELLELVVALLESGYDFAQPWSIFEHVFDRDDGNQAVTRLFNLHATFFTR